MSAKEQLLDELEVGTTPAQAENTQTTTAVSQDVLDSIFKTAADIILAENQSSVDAAINKRMEELGLNNVPTDTQENTSATTPTTNTSYSSGSYVPSDLVNQAQAALQAHLNNAPGAYQSKWQTQIDGILNAYRNREDFQYDLDSDALYQQYADQYALKGQLAMMDTMGQAAAMTGGYGNSFAATAGNQAYQSYLQQLNDVIPELSAMAYDRYQQEGEDMLTEYSLLSDRESSDYAKYQDQLNRYYTDLDYLANRYDSERAYDYGVYQDQIAYEDSKNAVVGNTGGNYTGGNETGDTPAREIPANILAKLATFTNNNDLAAYLDALEENDSITREEADSLYIEYMTPEQAKLAERDWKKASDGGINWFGGVDNNAEVKDEYGNTYTLSELKKALMAEGMNKDEAKEYVMNLQQRLGI